MKKLNLPIIRQALPEPKSLTMDEYLKFVQLHLRHTLDRKTYEAWRKKQPIKIPFKL